MRQAVFSLRRRAGRRAAGLHRARPAQEDGGHLAVVTRMIGALLRAFLVVLVIAAPAVITGAVGPDIAEVVVLVALFAAALTFFEYVTVYPGLVEFRDAPPFNRIRFLALAAMVVLLSLVCRDAGEASRAVQLFDRFGLEIAASLDFPYSPVRLMVLILPPEAAPEQVAAVRTTAGLAYLISLLTLVGFIAAIRLGRWPTRGGSFNVWINLPTFDPTTGGDVVRRLNREARFNVVAGFVLPFLVPAVVKSVNNVFDPMMLTTPHALIWTMTAWAFLPLSLLMRGIAMGRISAMISERRRGHLRQPAPERLA